jgi:hypothetical protein
MAVQRLMFLLFPCCMIRHTRKQLNGSINILTVDVCPSVLTFTAELFDIDKNLSDIDMKFHIDFDR